MTKYRLPVLLALAVTAAAIVVQAAPGEGATILRGDQLVAGSQNCANADAGTYRMAGDLVGCWYTDDFVVTQAKDNPGGSFKASGREHFIGCIDTNGNGSCGAGEPYGRFNTTFTFTAKLAPTGDEIHGRCHHPIVSGSGGFAGATGVLSFKDIPSEGRFPYHGNVQLEATEAGRPTGARTDVRTPVAAFISGPILVGARPG
jgi:hypothetical protein